MFGRLINLNDNHCHIIISRAVKLLYYNKLINQAQQIRNKNSYNQVKIILVDASKYKIELILIEPLLL